MRSATLFTAAALAGAAYGAAIEKRQSTGLTDADILNFALVLEHFESTFYSQALSKYDAAAFTSAGYTSNVRANIEQIAMDEAAHVSFLTTALSAAGATPVSACNYTFPYDSVTGFLGLAQVFEGIGTSAYLGAAHLISNPDYLTAAGSILTSEARHTSFIRLMNAYSPFVVEDTPLDPTAVTSLASPFFTSCPNGSAPPFQPFPAANLTSTSTIPGSMINVAAANATGSGLYCVFLSGLNQASSSYSNGSCMIPTANVSVGQAYGVISSSQTFNDSAVVAGPFVLQFDTKNNTGFGMSSNSSSSGSAAVDAAKTGAASRSTVAGFSMALVAAVSAFFL